MSDARLVEIGNGVANLPVEKLEEVARMFCEKCEENNRGTSRLHARDGLLAATDGRFIIKIADPRVKAIEKSKDGFLDFELDDEPTDEVADCDYILGELYRLLVEAKAPLAEKEKRDREEFLMDCRRRRAACPCCGADLYIDDCDYRLYEYDEFLTDNMPSGSDASLRLVAPGTPYRPAFSLPRFFTCVKAARMLGGHCRLFLNSKYAQFRGENFLIDIIVCRYGVDEVDMEITLPKKGGAA